MIKNPVNIDEIKVESVMSKDFLVMEKGATVRQVRDMFLKTEFKTLVIVDDKGVLQGVVSAFDFLKLFDAKGEFDQASTMDKPVSGFQSIIRFGGVSVGAQDSLRKCMEYMSSFRMRYLPVLDKGRKVVGMISVRDIIKFMLPE